MTIQDLYEEYICEYCKNCKNKKTNLCDIRVETLCDIIRAKCEAYEREN